MNNKSIKKILKVVIPLLLGLAILWALYSEMDFKELWEIMRNANLSIILISLIFGLIGNVIRGLRWELFINSLGYKPKRSSIVYATLGNYAVNFLFPRAGDIWRCAVVSKYDKIPFGKTFETYLVDKVLDLTASIILVFLSAILYLDFFISYFQNNPEYGQNIISLLSSPWPYIIIFGVIVFIVIILKTFKHTSIIKKVKDFFSEIRHDFKIVMRMKEKKRIILYTILIWLSFYLYFYICFYAFEFTNSLGIIAGLIVFSMSNVGVAVPVQGGIGAWHFMVISSLVILGVSNEEAKAFAFGIFTVQSVWIIICGVAGILLLPHVKRDIKTNETIK